MQLGGEGWAFLPVNVKRHFGQKAKGHFVPKIKGSRKKSVAVTQTMQEHLSCRVH